MTKGQESLNNIVEQRWGSNDFNLTIKQTNKQDFEIVEKELKALAVIKEKKVDVDFFDKCIEEPNDVDYKSSFDEYNTYNYKLTQAEFELLKEVLCDERKRNR